jgi:hypothetical protein
LAAGAKKAGARLSEQRRERRVPAEAIKACAKRGEGVKKMLPPLLFAAKSPIKARSQIRAA